MEIVVMQALVSLGLVALAVVLFLRSVRARDYEHADRLALLPMEEDTPAESAAEERSQV